MSRLVDPLLRRLQAWAGRGKRLHLVLGVTFVALLMAFALHILHRVEHDTAAAARKLAARRPTQVVADTAGRAALRRRVAALEDTLAASRRRETALLWERYRFQQQHREYEKRIAQHAGRDARDVERLIAERYRALGRDSLR